jgi:hypothetical protein
MPAGHRHWIATVAARIADPQTGMSATTTLATFRFQAPPVYTPDHLHGWTLGKLLRLYGQKLAAQRIWVPASLATPEVLVSFLPDPKPGRTRRIDNLHAFLEQALPDRPTRLPPVISFGSDDDEPYEGPDDDPADLSLPASAIEPFAATDQARAALQWAEAEQSLRALLAGWRDEPPTDHRALALARLLIVTQRLGRRSGMAVADQFAMEVRTLAASDPASARRALPPLRNLVLEAAASPERRRALSAVRAAWQAATRLDGGDEIPPW